MNLATIGLLAAGALALGALYMELEPGFHGDAACGRLAQFRESGQPVIDDFARHANDMTPDASHHIRLGRITYSERCDKATSLLRDALPAGSYDQLMNCIAIARDPAAARSCF